ncbi:hypothetical protein [Flavobacterium beibuense]|uniref:Universal stress protein n=1 Tax=Flavobacterium beibuense TaxID=657326 RepID=A0A444W5Q6_9FLAO|nr:hypothetical protein [Flavobacterium beibuense]RYJ41204.1 hypothetical protein NU09_3238 [Flavobacterium beibuense]
MKNIIIPTTIEDDTLTAVKTAVKYATGKNCSIVLMLLQKIPDTYSASHFLRETSPNYTIAQTKILQKCRETVATADNCRLIIHNQCGISGPLLKNLMEYLATDLVILTPSYKAEKNSLHSYCIQLLLNSKYPLLHLGNNPEENDFNKALYLEHSKIEFGINDIQKIISEQFSFKIVSQARIEESLEDMAAQITETISKNNIDILIEARKSTKRSLNRKAQPVNHNLGLPVLSVYAEAST